MIEWRNITIEDNNWIEVDFSTMKNIKSIWTNDITPVQIPLNWLKKNFDIDWKNNRMRLKPGIRAGNPYTFCFEGEGNENNRRV